MCAKHCETVAIWTAFLTLWYYSDFTCWNVAMKKTSTVRHRHVHALGIWHAAFGWSQSRIDDAVEASLDLSEGVERTGIADLKVQSSIHHQSSHVNVLPKVSDKRSCWSFLNQHVQRTYWGFCKRWMRTACYPMCASYTFMQNISKYIKIYKIYQHVQIKLSEWNCVYWMCMIGQRGGWASSPCQQSNIRVSTDFEPLDALKFMHVLNCSGLFWIVPDVEDHCQCPFGAAGREVGISESWLRLLGIWNLDCFQIFSSGFFHLSPQNTASDHC